GAVPRRGRARLAAARALDRERAGRAGFAGVSHGAPQPLPRPLALARRGLSRLEPASLQPHERALERRPGAREGAVRRDPGDAAGRPDARLVRRPLAVPRAPEPLYDAGGAPGVRAGPQRQPRLLARLAGRAVSQVLRHAPGLSRWPPRADAYLHRLHEQLREIHEADGAAPLRGQVKSLVTGVAGFIGMHCAQRLMERGDEVLGIDNLSPYYSVQLKKDRLAQLKGLRFEQLDIADGAALSNWFERNKPERVLHLAAQAGVRYSLENPAAYIEANLVGFANLLECCRRQPPAHLVFASSSSVYGTNSQLPWTETQNV